MLRGLYCAASGMDVQQAKIDSISNNLANVSTPGYKKESIQVQSFPEVLLLEQGGAQRQKIAPGVSRAIGTAEIGGVQVAGVSVDHAAGAVQETGNAADIVLKGPGFLAVIAPSAEDPGRVCYTRNGSLLVDSEGYLTVAGYRVLGENGPIMVGDARISINQDGSIAYDGAVRDRLRLVEFADVNRLYKERDGIFVDAGEAGGRPAILTTVAPGYLEMSNVNIVDEMVNLVSVIRSYEANQRLIQAYDEQLAKAVNQIGSLR